MDGGCEGNVVHIINEGYKVWGALIRLVSNRGLGINVNKYLFEGVIEPKTLFAAVIGYENPTVQVILLHHL